MIHGRINPPGKGFGVFAGAVALLAAVAVAGLPRARRKPAFATAGVAAAPSFSRPGSSPRAQDAEPAGTMDGKAGYRTLVASIRRQMDAGADGLGLLRALARSRPAWAMDAALALGRGDDERDRWVTELAKDWTARDAQEAWDWLGRQTSRMEKLANGSLIGVVLGGMAAQAPPKVVESLDILLRQGDVPGAIPPLVACRLGLQALVEHGALDVARGAVEDWARSPRAPGVDASAYDVVAEAIGQTSWSEAAAWLESLPASRDRASAFAVLASNWSGHDPTAALAWAESLAPDGGRLAAIQAAFSDWAGRDAAGAGAWLPGYAERAAADAETDQLMAGFATYASTLRQDPELALGWIRGVRDDAQRAALTERAVLRWGRRDAPAAANYVAGDSDLTPDQKLSLQRKLADRQIDPVPSDD